MHTHGRLSKQRKKGNKRRSSLKNLGSAKKNNNNITWTRSLSSSYLSCGIYAKPSSRRLAKRDNNKNSQPEFVHLREWKYGQRPTNTLKCGKEYFTFFHHIQLLPVPCLVDWSLSAFTLQEEVQSMCGMNLSSFSAVLLFAQDQEGTQVSKMANEVRVLGLWRVLFLSAPEMQEWITGIIRDSKQLWYIVAGWPGVMEPWGLLWREERRNVQSQNQMLRTVTWLFILVLFLFFSYYNTTTTTTRWCRRGWPKRPLLRLGLLWSIHKYILGIFWRGGSPGQILLLPTVYISIDYVQQQQLMDVVLGASREAEKETQPWI